MCRGFGLRPHPPTNFTNLLWARSTSETDLITNNVVLYYHVQSVQRYSYITETRPGRMTPAKHSIPHLCVRFGPGGQLVKVMPNRPSEGEPATVEIHDLSEMLQDNPETDELKSFPGPLVRSVCFLFYK